jgi:hypothetical protein
LLRKVAALGVFDTRTKALRGAAEKIEQLGINSAQTIIEAPSRSIFRDHGEFWLKSLANRRRDPVEQTTIANRRYAVDKWIYPTLGDTYIANVNNLALKNLVDKPTRSHRLQSAIIQISSTTTSAGMRDILRYARGQYRVLYVLLTGCGPLRAGEALGLEIDKHISEDFRTLSVEQKAKRAEIQPYLKTKNGVREVDLCSELASMLREFVGNRRSVLLFQTSTGAQVLQSNSLRDSLHPILDQMEHERGGFNVFRRFRLTHLEKSECPDALKHFPVTRPRT